jgi:CHASE2 domain-containing sensor protein
VSQAPDESQAPHGLPAPHGRPAPHEPPAPHGSGGRGPFIESLLLATVALVVLNFHPFGSAHLRRHFSQDLVYAWFGDAAWLHPRQPAAAAGAPAAPRAVVVLVDDTALALRGTQWPVPLAFDAQLLTELDVLRPRAVMLDFVLIDRAPSDDVCALLAAADRLRADGISVYLAVTGQEDFSLLGSANCTDDAGNRLRAEQVLIPVSVRRQVDETDFVSRRYPFEQRDDDGGQRGRGGAPGLPSAAVRIYCDTTAQRARCAADLARGYSPEAGFELAWSPRGDPFNSRWSKAGCGGPSSVSAIFDRTMLPRETGCPPIATLFASALLNPAEDSALGPNNERLFDLVEGSTVFIGGNFRAGGDLITTPMHTLLPGVYYHAVAFENLAIFDGKPKIREEFRQFPMGIYLYDWLVLWALAAIFVWRETWIGAAAVPHAGQHGGHHAGPLSPSASARAWLARLIARTPVVLSLGLLVISALFLAAYPVLQLWALTVAIVAAICIEIREASQGELTERLRNVGLYLGALGLSLSVVAFAVWFGYRWLRLPPGDWVGYLSFSTVGFFVAHTAIVDFGRHVGSIRLTKTSPGGAA